MECMRGKLSNLGLPWNEPQPLLRNIVEHEPRLLILKTAQIDGQGGQEAVSDAAFCCEYS